MNVTAIDGDCVGLAQEGGVAGIVRDICTARESQAEIALAADAIDGHFIVGARARDLSDFATSRAGRHQVEIGNVQPGNRLAETHVEGNGAEDEIGCLRRTRGGRSNRVDIDVEGLRCRADIAGGVDGLDGQRVRA